MKKHTISIVMIFFALLFAGCAAWLQNYGSTEMMPKDSPEVTIEALTEKWRDYDIYYAGLGVRFPLGVMFDPKDGDTTLTGDRWTRVEDQETLREIIRWIYPNTRYEPELVRILGPDGRFFGYLYYSHGPVVLKKTGDSTMNVFNLTEPIEEGLGGPSER